MEKSLVQGAMGAGTRKTPQKIQQKEERERLRMTRSFLRQSGAFLVGIAGGGTILYGTFAPFGLGLTLGISGDGMLPCAVGAAVAVLFRLEGARAVAMVCALGAAVVMRWGFPKRFSLAVFVGCGTLGAVSLCFLSLEGRQQILFCCADALVAGGTAFLLHASPPEAMRGGTILCGAILVAALVPLSLGRWNMGMMVSLCAELFLCCYGREKEALALSGAAGIALCAVRPSLWYAAVGMECGTAVAVWMPPGDRILCLAAYGGGCLTGVLCVDTPGQVMDLVVSALPATLGFVLLPQKILEKRTAPIRDVADSTRRVGISEAASHLGAAAQSLTELAETVNGVYQTMPKRCESWRWVIDNTHDTLCAHCGRRTECWEGEYTVTMDGMEAVRPILEENEHIEPQTLPAQLSRCIHPTALSSILNRSFALYRSRQEAHIHAEAMRLALTEQYSAVAAALSALGDQLSEGGTPDPYRGGRVAAYFTALGTPPLECAVTVDGMGRTRAAVTLPRVRFRESEMNAISKEVGRICRCGFELPQKLTCRSVTTLLFREKTALHARFGWAGSAAKNDISGDAVQQFCGTATAQMVLCDGMGTGCPAAIDGTMAAELTARLLKAGFTAELAARLVNVALSLKSEEESGATLDLISVDLYTGTATLFKAGAVPSFLVRSGKARTVGGASLPIGILGTVNGQSRMVHLAAGDIAVLVSDGLLVDGTGWIEQQLELSVASGETPQQIAQTLVQMASARAEKTGRPDDITAAVMRLEDG